MMKKTKTQLALLATATVFLISGGIFLPQERAGASEEQPTPSAQAPQAMPVTVTVIKPKPIQLWKNFSGHIVAVDKAEIRPQVSGRITDIRFKDGQYVEKGDILIVIDPRPYEAALAQAKASLEAVETQAILAEKEYERAKALIKTEAVSQRLLDERSNNQKVAQAAVQEAKALVQSASINLDYAFVKAPISGKVSRAEITEGNLVQAGPSAPLLTSIVADDQLYVDFEVDEKTYINSRQHVGSAEENPTEVRLKLPGSEKEFHGYVHSFDNQINPSSGTVRARALFENEDKMLLPGMSVSVMMGSPGDQERILVSERAIGTDQDRKFVYVVNGENKTSYREIKIGESVDGKRIVLSGLEQGDMVITEGIMRIRPDMPVSPQEKADHAALENEPAAREENMNSGEEE